MLPRLLMKRSAVRTIHCHAVVDRTARASLPNMVHQYANTLRFLCHAQVFEKQTKSPYNHTQFWLMRDHRPPIRDSLCLNFLLN